jgi:hypothetical protein
MNWKKPKSNLFFVPVPERGQNRMELIDWKFDEKKERKKMGFTDPDTKEEYQAEIIDYLGPFEMERIPDWTSRQCTDLESVTGTMLKLLLRKKLPEFQTTDKVLFYQCKII